MNYSLTQMSGEEWSEFIRQACHDLRTPLTTLQGYGELALYQKEPLTPQNASHVALEALRSVHEVDTFLSILSWREKGETTLRTENGDPLPLLEKASVWIRRQYPDVMFSMEQTAPETVCVIDTTKLYQGFITLLTLALTDAAQTKRFFLHVLHDEQSVIIQVTKSKKPIDHFPESAESFSPTYRHVFINEVVRTLKGEVNFSTSPSVFQISLPLV